MKFKPTTHYLLEAVRCFSLAVPLLIVQLGCELAGAATEHPFSTYSNADSTYVMVAAHRGGYISNGTRVHAENSLAACENSILLGADILEIDVRKTIDDHLVIMHDSTVNRTTTGSGNVSDMTLAQLRDLRLLGPDNQPTDEPVPTLEEIMTLAKGRALINLDKLDIKDATLMGLAMDVLHATDTVNHAIFKGGATAAEIAATRASYPDDTIDYMPVLSNKSESETVTALTTHTPHAIELIFDNIETGMLSSTSTNTAHQTDTRIWINSLWGSLCANHHDSIALGGDPDGSWGWLVQKGATIIQTDNTPQLVTYLESRGLRSLSTGFSFQEYNFDDGTTQGWKNTMTSTQGVAEYVVTSDNQGDRIYAKSGSYTAQPSPFGSRDGTHETVVFSSPEFRLPLSDQYSFMQFSLLGGTGGAATAPADYASLPANSSASGFMGVALRRVSDGAYLLSARRSSSAQGSSWQTFTWDWSDLMDATTGDDEQTKYRLDLIDGYSGGWGWVVLDSVLLPECQNEGMVFFLSNQATKSCLILTYNASKQ